MSSKQKQLQCRKMFYISVCKVFIRFLLFFFILSLKDVVKLPHGNMGHFAYIAYTLHIISFPLLGYCLLFVEHLCFNFVSLPYLLFMINILEIAHWIFYEFTYRCCHKHDCCYGDAEAAGCHTKTDKYKWTCRNKEADCGMCYNKEMRTSS